MAQLVVIRDSKEGKQTTGIMQWVDEAGNILFECCTLELPWKNNEQGKSCIIADTYDCEKVPPSGKIKYPHILIKNVLNRSGVKIHIANYYFQLLGCIAVGKSFIDMNKDGLKDVSDSEKTLKALMKVLPDKFTLTIKYKDQ